MLSVDVPVPDAPDSGDVLDKGGELATWLAHQGKATMTIIAILIITVIVASLLRRPFVRGLVVGGLILVVIVAALSRGGS